MTIFVQENVFWLEISIDDSVRVKTANCIDDLGSVYSCSVLIESLLLPQISEQLPSVQKINYEVKFGLSLKRKVQPDDILVFNFFQDVSFGYRGLVWILWHLP